MSAFGAPRRHFRLTDSTNERARELALTGAPSGTVVTADAQTAGRGRHGRRWSAPPGKALLYSAILRPLGERHLLLPIAAGIAACEAIDSVAPVCCEIKWPNDAWIEGRKVAGILIEARPPEFAVIGIGVNVAIEPEEFPPDLRWPPTSVGHGASPDQLRRALDERLGEWVEAEPERLLSSFRERDALAGREIVWEGAGAPGVGHGVAAGIDNRGNLRVRTADGDELALGAGEVRLTRR
jgi:BirA family transcriptional regulator, biotin operon repressor / biotin---[acetyl-CoA-carboxylase] ligase